MAYYRKKRGTDTWHWCKNCSNWTGSGYIEKQSPARATTGELCYECLAEEKAGDCSR